MHHQYENWGFYNYSYKILYTTSARVSGALGKQCISSFKMFATSLLLQEIIVTFFIQKPKYMTDIIILNNCNSTLA